jgi:hypothetical protein
VSRLPESLKRELDEVDQMLEVVQGKLMTISGRAGKAGLPKTAVHVKRKNGAIGHARVDLREQTPRIAGEEQR